MGQNCCKDQSSTGAIRISNTPSPYLVECHKKHTHCVNCIALSDDHSLLAAGSEDTTISVWSTKTKKTELFGILEGHESYVTCLFFYDTALVSGSADKTIKKWDLTTSTCLFTFTGHTDRISKILCVADDLMVSGSHDKTAKLWLFDRDNYGDNDVIPENLRTYDGHIRSITSMIFIRDPDGSDNNIVSEDEDCDIRKGDLLITGSGDNTAISWNVHTTGQIHVFRGHTKPISKLALDDDRKVLFTASYDGDIRSWYIDSGEMIRVFEGHRGPVLSLEVVNRLLYSGGSDETARCWVAEFADIVNIYKGHTHSIPCLKFHDGVLYTGCGDALIRAYDARDGRLLRKFEGHRRAITSLIVIDNKMFTSSYDGNIIVWDTSDIKIANEFIAEDEVKKL